MLRKIIICIIIIISAIQIYSQTEYRKHLLDLIKKSKLDTTYQFIAIGNNRDTIISEITYYGNTKNGLKVFYIHETYPTVSCRHGFLMLYLIDSNGKKYFYHDIDKPDNLENGIISFKHIDNSGNPYYYKMNLNKDIPLFLCPDNCYSYLIDEEKLK